MLAGSRPVPGRGCEMLRNILPVIVLNSVAPLVAFVLYWR
jgi:hypothetical protein